MLPTMVRAESVIMSPEVNATFTTPWGAQLHHEHAAANRPPGERHDDRRKARTKGGGGDDAWGGHGVTRSSA